MNKYTETTKIVNFLKDDFPKLTDFEALQIATKMMQNEILADAFCVSASGKYPVALEAIAIALGYDNKQF